MTNRNRLYPACLPLQQRTSETGYQSGWSAPIPYHILKKYSPGLLRVYSDFFKQNHYRMNVSQRCEDPKTNINGDQFQFPTNTYYPPGTICAKDVYQESCFFSGDSGSPLMMRLGLYCIYCMKIFHLSSISAMMRVPAGFILKDF